MNETTKAMHFAIAAHSAVNQTRKYTGEPYYTHPIGVALLLDEEDATDAMTAAAMLHDIVEDTAITLEELGNHFSPEVVALVDELTDKSSLEDGNRATRKEIDRERLANASREAQIIKCADLLHNGVSIFAFDPNFSKVFSKEMGLLLLNMTKAHGHPLHLAATELLNEYFTQ